MSTTSQLIRLIAPYRAWMLLAALLGVLTIASSIGLMSAAAWIIATAALHPPVGELHVAIAAVRFFGITRGVFRYLERYVSHQTTFRLLARLRGWFYTGIEPLAPARLMQHRSGDLLARVVADIDTLENVYLRAIAPPLIAFVISAGMFVFMALIDLRLALTLLVYLTLAGVGVPILTHLLSRSAGAASIQTRADLTVAVVDGVQGMADLVAYGAGDRQWAQVSQLTRALQQQQTREARITGLHTALLSLIMSCAAITVLVLAIPLVRAGEIKGVMLAVLLLATLTSFEAVLPLPGAFQQWSSNLAAARRLFVLTPPPAPRPVHGEGESGKQPDGLTPLAPLSIQDILSRWRSIKLWRGGNAGTLPDSSSGGVLPYIPTNTKSPYEPNSPSPTLERGLGGEVSLSVRDLHFRYTPDDPPALNGISFTAEAGQTIAIIGTSGAGKTTLLNLLLRFWEYDTGAITLAGPDGDTINLRDLDPDHSRALMSVVSQHTYLFNATIRQNLQIAKPDATDNDLIRATTAAQLHDFIATLPDGYDTWIGEQGLGLSGGERQRLAIARAILKDAPVLLLDEPTANLDTITERAILDTIFEALPDRTTLLITHRLAGLDAADQILVLRAGQIVERGTHTDLMQIGMQGHYRRLLEVQRGRVGMG